MTAGPGRISTRILPTTPIIENYLFMLNSMYEIKKKFGHIFYSSILFMFHLGRRDRLKFGLDYDNYDYLLSLFYLFPDPLAGL